MQIIVNADDLGYTRGVTEGIIEAYQKGIVTSATVMCNMPNAVYAARRINEVPGLGLGVHLNLTCGKPLTQPHTLVQPDGTFLKNRVFYKVFVDPDEVEAEFAAQIERFCDLFGRLPTHLDCHQGCYDGQTLTMAEVGGIAPEHPTEEILRRTKRLAENGDCRCAVTVISNGWMVIMAIRRHRSISCRCCRINRRRPGWNSWFIPAGAIWSCFSAAPIIFHGSKSWRDCAIRSWLRRCGTGVWSSFISEAVDFSLLYRQNPLH